MTWVKSGFAICLMLVVSNLVRGQNVQQEINTQVWIPFIKTFNEHDTKRFMALHSRDAVRSPRDAKVVWNWDAYFQNQEKGDLRETNSGAKRDLQLRFLERINGSNLAIEVGIYKTTSVRSDGTTRSFYGKFHVVLRKENGVWKILVDTDSSENGTIGEDDFLTAAAME